MRLVFASDALEVRAALAALKRALEPAGLSAEEHGSIELALGEVLNNVVEHAYGPGQRGEIELICDRRADGLAICVRDSGRGFPGPPTPLARGPQGMMARDDLPEGGWGWFLVGHLCQVVEYRRVECRNELRLVIALAQRGEGGPVPPPREAGEADK